MPGYEYSRRTISRWPWDAQAATYREMFENAERNASLWKAKYEAAVKGSDE